VMNQRLGLALAVGAIFLAIFAVTALILLILGVPERDPEQVGAPAPRATRQPDRAQTFTAPEPYAPPAGWPDDRSFRYGSAPDQGSVLDGYRFRPLEERELRRLGGRTDALDDRSTAASGRDDRGFDGPVFRQDRGLPDGFTSDWGETPYRFRPTEPPRSPPDPWRPMQEQRSPRGSTDPGLFEPPPQWGATPPVLPPPWPELYPNLVPQNDHRLTVR
jgi:hypothetical protein